MPPQSAAMELKVLISILQSGQGLQSILGQINSVSAALSKLQAQASAGGTTPGGGPSPIPVPPIPPVTTPTLKAISSDADSAAKAIEGLEKGIYKVIAAVKFLAGGFLALQGVQFLKRLADEAAHVEVLTTVLHVVALNAGYTAEQIDKVDASVQKLGITAAASKQALTSFLQARLPLQYAKDLSRAAQDLAVVSGMDSSSTFQRLILNIQQVDTLGLRWMGIIIDRSQAEEKFKEKIGATTRELNKREQQEALMLAVLEKAKLLEGAYVNAMGDVEKQISSLVRLTTTYRATLGEALLPAYSAIVRVIGTTFEKLQLLALEFAANREQAQAWAQTATTIAEAVSRMLVFIAEHIDQIIVLARVYLEWKVAVLAVNAAISVVAGFARLLVIVRNLQLAFMALRAGAIGYGVAMSAVGAASTEAALGIIKTEIAAQRAAVAAGTATVAVSGLTLALGTLAGVLAIPIIGYIILKIRAEQEEKEKREAKRPTLERAAAEVEKGALSIRQLLDLPIPVLERTGSRIREFYDKWRLEIGHTGKDSAELREEFARSVEAYREQFPAIAGRDQLEDFQEQLATARDEANALIVKGEQLRRDRAAGKATREEIVINDRQQQEAAQKITELENMLKEAAKAFLPSNLDQNAVRKQIDLVDDLKVAYDKVAQSGTASPQEVSKAQAALKVQTAILDAYKEAIEDRLKFQNITNDERKQLEEALASVKKRLQETADTAEETRTAIQQLFGEKFTFTPEGDVLSGQFAKQFSGFDTLLKNAQKELIETGKISAKTQEEIKKGITVLGQSAQQTADLAKLRGARPSLGALGIPGADEAYQEALRLAQLGVRQARLSVGAPLVTEERARVQRVTDARIQAAEKQFNSVKALGAAEGAVLQQQYDQNLIGLAQYHTRRLERIEEEGTAERNLQQERIDQAKALAAIPGQDPNVVLEAVNRIAAAREALRQIETRTEQQIQDLIIQTQNKRRQIESQIIEGRLQIAASYGGEKEALELANYELNKELNTIMAIGTAEADALIRQKTIISNYETINKKREEELQRALQLEEVERSQLDLNQQRRQFTAAEIERRADTGEITSHVALRLRTEQTYAEMYDNRLKKESLLRTLEIQKADNLRKEVDLRTELDALIKEGLSPAEAEKRQQDLHLANIKALQQTEAGVIELDTAYLGLATNIETYNEQLTDSFIKGFTHAFTSVLNGFDDFGKAMANLGKSISEQIIQIFVQAFTERLFKRLGVFSFVDRLMDKIFGGGSTGVGSVNKWGSAVFGGVIPGGAEGGVVVGPGTGTSDSVPAMLSAGEHVMPAARAAQFMPLLEDIRSGRILPFAKGGVVQSIAIAPIIPRRYAGGGVVMTDAGASSVQTGGAPGNMIVTMHPDTLNMTMREWLEHEVVRQQGRR